MTAGFVPSGAGYYMATDRPERLPREAMVIAGGLFLAAVALRLVPILALPGINHPDEIFQSLEPAHRLVFGYGFASLNPWHSWILPGSLAALIEIARLFGDGAEVYVPFVQTVLAALSASAVVCTYFWSERCFGRWCGLAAASPLALWPDAIYFDGRSLSEPVAATMFVLALYLAVPGYQVTSRRRLAVSGALFVLAAILRIQLAPAIGAAALWVVLGAPRGRFLPIAGGAVAALVLNAVLETLTAGYPFAPEWGYVVGNLYFGVASAFGTAPWDAYLRFLADYWSVSGFLLLALALVGAWRFPLPFTTAIIILAAHSLVPHKEYRFIYPGIVLLLMTAGFGLAQLVDWVIALQATSDGARLARPFGVAAAVAATALLSFGVAMSPYSEGLWRKGRDMERASIYIEHLSNVCGVGTAGIFWWDTHGYTFLHRDVPLYWPMNDREFARDFTGFNTLIAPAEMPGVAAYGPPQCFGAICVAQRHGECASVPVQPPGALRPEQAGPGRWRN